MTRRGVAPDFLLTGKAKLELPSVEALRTVREKESLWAPGKAPLTKRQRTTRRAELTKEQTARTEKAVRAVEAIAKVVTPSLTYRPRRKAKVKAKVAHPSAPAITAARLRALVQERAKGHRLLLSPELVAEGRTLAAGDGVFFLHRQRIRKGVVVALKVIEGLAATPTKEGVQLTAERLKVEDAERSRTPNAAWIRCQGNRQEVMVPLGAIEVAERGVGIPTAALHKVKVIPAKPRKIRGKTQTAHVRRGGRKAKSIIGTGGRWKNWGPGVRDPGAFHGMAGKVLTVRQVVDQIVSDRARPQSSDSLSPAADLAAKVERAEAQVRKYEVYEREARKAGKTPSGKKLAAATERLTALRALQGVGRRTA